MVLPREFIALLLPVVGSLFFCFSCSVAGAAAAKKKRFLRAKNPKTTLPEKGEEENNNSLEN